MMCSLPSLSTLYALTGRTAMTTPAVGVSRACCTSWMTAACCCLHAEGSVSAVTMGWATEL